MLQKSKTISILTRTIFIVIGSLIYSFGISNILNPNSLAPGGITGISIIINHYTGVSLGLIVFLLNIPIITVGIKVFGFKHMSSTFFTIIISSVFMDVFAPIDPIVTEPILCAVYGGILYSTGLGIIFKCDSTTGGSDIIVKLLKLKFPYMETGKLFLILDAFVVTLSAIAFKNITVALFAGITIFISSIVFDKILYGTDGAKLLYIISAHSDEITEKFLTDLNVGVTYLNAEGAYSNDSTKVMMCAMRKPLLPKAKNIVKECDPRAFVIIGNANEILGEGFKSHNAKLL